MTLEALLKGIRLGVNLYMAGPKGAWGFVREHLSLGHLLLMPPHSQGVQTGWGRVRS